MRAAGRATDDELQAARAARRRAEEAATSAEVDTTPPGMADPVAEVSRLQAELQREQEAVGLAR